MSQTDSDQRRTRLTRETLADVANGRRQASLLQLPGWPLTRAAAASCAGEPGQTLMDVWRPCPWGKHEESDIQELIREAWEAGMGIAD
jgi:hypothetical protein